MLNTKDSASVLVLVFLLVLAVAIAAYYIFKRIKEKQEDEQSYIKPIQKKEQQQPNLVKTVAKEKVTVEIVEDDDEISDELIAVLTAAISAMRAANERSFIIKRVTKRKNRPVWNTAGIKNSIKPF